MAIFDDIRSFQKSRLATKKNKNKSQNAKIVTLQLFWNFQILKNRAMSMEKIHEDIGLIPG